VSANLNASPTWSLSTRVKWHVSLADDTMTVDYIRPHTAKEGGSSSFKSGIQISYNRVTVFRLEMKAFAAILEGNEILSSSSNRM
jgi:hypothetical protein